MKQGSNQKRTSAKGRQVDGFDLRNEPTVSDKFFEPLLDVFGRLCRQSTECPKLPDEKFLILACQRVLSDNGSGRELLQECHELADMPLARGTYFDSIGSSRRLLLAEEISVQLFCESARRLQNQGRDYLSAVPEVANRAVFAADGCLIKHVCHALRDAKRRHVAPKSIYLQCLHTGLLYNLGSIQGDGRYAHEMPAFRQRLPDFLEALGDKKVRGSAPPIMVTDGAYIDNNFWQELRLLDHFGARFILPLKEDLQPATYEEIGFDRSDEINDGVVRFSKVVFDSGITMRLVEYRDPETGRELRFLTSVDDLEPGAIAYLYRLRWRIEKAFDTCKNQLHETKQWATGKAAREIQSHSIAMAHNLMMLFRDFLEFEYGIVEEKIEAKRERSIENRQKNTAEHGGHVHPMVLTVQPIVQLTAQFIRCLRNHVLFQERLLKEAIPIFAARMRVYL